MKSVNRDHIETVVIGAGVVGLAIARALALKGQDVLVLEKTRHIGMGISSRNSEVIHAGLYYPADSLKAQLCVRGRALLYEYAAMRRIDYQKCGKIIVATKLDQVKQLEEIQIRAQANGVEDLQPLSQQKISETEPDLRGQEGLFSPSTGIIDSHGLMLALQGDLEHHGGICTFLTSFLSAKQSQDGFILTVQSQGEKTELLAQNIINTAGLDAVRVAQNIENLSSQYIPGLRYAKGNYFALNMPSPFKHLIYPVPEDGGLGVHLTLDLGGKARFGPDVEWVEAIDYQVHPARADLFYELIRQYWPELPEGALVPDYAGVRPKIYTYDGEPIIDFVIQGEDEHAIPGLVNLFGIESPGLTSSLAIAEYVADML